MRYYQEKQVKYCEKADYYKRKGDEKKARDYAAKCNYYKLEVTKITKVEVKTETEVKKVDPVCLFVNNLKVHSIMSILKNAEERLAERKAEE